MAEFVGSIITDCGAPIDQGRQELAFKRLFDGASPTFIGVDPTSPAPALEAAAHLVDQLNVLDSFHGSPSQRAIVDVNVAWRGSAIKKEHDNGTPFCFFERRGTIVTSTFNECLSLARDHGLVDEVEVVDIPEVVEAAMKFDDLSPEEAEMIINTQFRSLWFQSRLARWVAAGRSIPSTTRQLDHTTLPPTGRVVCLVEGFGNAKTTILPEQVDFKEGKEVVLASGALAVCHARLADVPTGQTAITIGSSGYREARRLEVVIGKGRAAEAHGLTVGSTVLKSDMPK